MLLRRLGKKILGRGIQRSFAAEVSPQIDN